MYQINMVFVWKVTNSEKRENFMKILINLFVVMVMMMVSVEAGWEQFWGRQRGGMPTDPIGASTLPPVRVRRSEFTFTSLGGGTQIRKSQRTDTTASQEWVREEGRNRVNVNQTTWKTKSVTVAPQVYYAPIVDDPKGPKSAYVAAQVPLKPIVQSITAPLKTK